MQTKPRTPVIWLHGLECTCCSESFIRSSHPLAKDVVLSMISLDYSDTLMDAAGHPVAAATVLVIGNLVVIALEGLVVSIQTTRLVLFEFFARFLEAQGRVFSPLPPPPSSFQESPS